MRKRSAITKLEKLQLQRSHAVLLLMAEHDLTVEDVAAATGVRTKTVYKAIGSYSGPSAVIEFLEKKIGRPFTELWRKFPNHSAA